VSSLRDFGRFRQRSRHCRAGLSYAVPGGTGAVGTYTSRLRAFGGCVIAFLADRVGEVATPLFRKCGERVGHPGMPCGTGAAGKYTSRFEPSQDSVTGSSQIESAKRALPLFRKGRERVGHPVPTGFSGV